MTTTMDALRGLVEQLADALATCREPEQFEAALEAVEALDSDELTEHYLRTLRTSTALAGRTL